MATIKMKLKYDALGSCHTLFTITDNLGNVIATGITAVELSEGLTVLVDETATSVNVHSENCNTTDSVATGFTTTTTTERPLYYPLTTCTGFSDCGSAYFQTTDSGRAPFDAVVGNAYVSRLGGVACCAWTIGAGTYTQPAGSLQSFTSSQVEATCPAAPNYPTASDFVFEYSVNGGAWSTLGTSTSTYDSMFNRPSPFPTALNGTRNAWQIRLRMTSAKDVTGYDASGTSLTLPVERVAEPGIAKKIIVSGANFSGATTAQLQAGVVIAEELALDSAAFLGYTFGFIGDTPLTPFSAFKVIVYYGCNKALSIINLSGQATYSSLTSGGGN